MPAGPSLYAMPRLIGLACVVMLCAAVVGAQNAPFVGVVPRDKTPIYAGGGPTYYHVGYLDAGAKVQVDEVVFEWLKIAPPTGTFSYVSKAFVAPAADGRSGQINADRTMVMAAGVNGPGESVRRQVELAKGETVQIAAEDGNYYKILPPKGTYVYLAPGALGGDAGPTPVLTPVAPVPPVAVVTPVAAVPATQPGPTPAVVEPPKPSPFALAETRLKELAALPLDQQPLDEVLAAYQALAGDAGLSPQQQQVVSIRIAQIERNRQLAQGLADLAVARAQAEQEAKAAAERIAALEQQQKEMPKPTPRYEAVGMLATSSIYTGENMPLMYRVVDPASGGTRAYLLPTTEIDPRAYLGRVVGILTEGKPRFDAASSLRILTPKQVDVLAAAN